MACSFTAAYCFGPSLASICLRRSCAARFAGSNCSACAAALPASSIRLAAKSSRPSTRYASADGCSSSAACASLRAPAASPVRSQTWASPAWAAATLLSAATAADTAAQPQATARVQDSPWPGWPALVRVFQASGQPAAPHPSGQASAPPGGTRQRRSCAQCAPADRPLLLSRHSDPAPACCFAGPVHALSSSCASAVVGPQSQALRQLRSGLRRCLHGASG